jgi:hypothetical protein
MSASHPYRVLVFGKEGCDKCKTLNGRLDRILAEPAYADFEKHYCDIFTVDGLVALCEAEVLNPQRLPSFQVLRMDSEANEYRRIPQRASEGGEPATSGSPVPTYVGIETDYSGTGVIPPEVIRTVLDEARAISPR